VLHVDCLILLLLLWFQPGQVALIPSLSVATI
jgi:hypothetical protein